MIRNKHLLLAALLMSVGIYSVIDHPISSASETALAAQANAAIVRGIEIITS